MDKNNIIKELGKANTISREKINELLLSCFLEDNIIIDGEIYPKSKLEEWYKTLEEIDKFCYFV